MIEETKDRFGGNGTVRQIPLTPEAIARALSVAPPDAPPRRGERSFAIPVSAPIEGKPAKQHREPKKRVKPPKKKPGKSGRPIEHDGKSLTLREWAVEIGINFACLQSRWMRGLRGAELLLPTMMPCKPPSPHGTINRYRRGACRCELCTAVHTAYARDYVARRKARNVSGSVAA